MKEMKDLLKSVKTLAITCSQWGDTGKGKFVDLFSQEADIIIRGTGGDNAGHTICWKNSNNEVEELITHILPSGILYDSSGKYNIVGRGAAVNLKSLIQEINSLDEKKLSYNNLMIALNAIALLPQHIVLDRVKESQCIGKIGTTGKGVGPAYVDHYNRTGLIINDLLNPDIFSKKLHKNLEEKIRLLSTYDPAIVKNIMQDKSLDYGIYYDEKKIFNFEAIIHNYLAYGQRVKDFIVNTDDFVDKFIGKKMILLEGAQGALLSVDYGTHPYVTSSDCTIFGLARGSGIDIRAIDLSLAIVKAPIMTRVGEGPFVTEIGSEKSRNWCNSGVVNREIEVAKYINATVNDEDEFSQGIAIRIVGNEYGATTTRPRRTGWLDLPLLRHTLKYSGLNTILTKIDVLNQCEIIKICVGHEYFGPDYQYGQKILRSSDKINNAIIHDEVLSNCRPIYQEFPGWKQGLDGINDFNSLPKELITIINFISDQVKMYPRIISIGPQRSQTIIV